MDILETILHAQSTDHRQQANFLIHHHNKNIEPFEGHKLIRSYEIVCMVIDL